MFSNIKHFVHLENLQRLHWVSNRYFSATFLFGFAEHCRNSVVVWPERHAEVQVCTLNTTLSKGQNIQWHLPAGVHTHTHTHPVEVLWPFSSLHADSDHLPLLNQVFRKLWASFWATIVLLLNWTLIWSMWLRLIDFLDFKNWTLSPGLAIRKPTVLLSCLYTAAVNIIEITVC